MPDTQASDSLPSFDHTFSKPTTTTKSTTPSIKRECHEVPNCLNGRLSPEDILNMDIIFDNSIPTMEPSLLGNQTNDGSEISKLNASKSIESPTNMPRDEDETMVDDDGQMLDADSHIENVEEPTIKVEMDVDENESVDETGEEDEKEESGDTNDESRDSTRELVVVASHCVDDPNNVIYEVYAVSPITGELSDKPLDLPADVVEQIRKSMDV